MIYSNHTFQYYAEVGFSESGPVVLESCFTPENGMRYSIYHRGGSANYSSETSVEIWFGDELLFSTYGSESDEVYINCDGDGVKQFKIRLINDSLYTATLGAFFVYSYGPLS